ncbi:hypothetical protein [Laribacter hongkongensis]|nr:hypothetical protein [Laribacter hongkongensis]MCG8994216.1 hypothetical protein [Laribacter hongkongensis]MCG9009013.1 hypothetical protein [Laribacter hongkongensis]MCG9021496.1 hypothetical protein [Laribacter hongkongensis]MCG9046749.1 hypothetical protein [Laribacter hongkongensis]MCG9072702.1 hypothetical protein [Laribacter hongkongensis]
MTQVSVPVNDRGYRIGQHHHRAGLTDADVELIRILHERDGLSYTALAYKFEVPKSTIAAICQYKRRAQVVSRWKLVTARKRRARPAEPRFTPQTLEYLKFSMRQMRLF